MIGPGMSYDRMITGDFIKNRDEQTEDPEEPGPAAMF
jgi:hypothetical protein